GPPVGHSDFLQRRLKQSVLRLQTRPLTNHALGRKARKMHDVSRAYLDQRFSTMLQRATKVEQNLALENCQVFQSCRAYRFTWADEVSTALGIDNFATVPSQSACQIRGRNLDMKLASFK